MITMLFALLSLAQAGPVVTDVRVCGVTAPYLRYNDLNFGVQGSSSTGINNEFFRIRGYLGIEQNQGALEQGKSAAIADLLSVLQAKGIAICLTGNLETIERDNRLYYLLTPKSFQITDTSPDLLVPSQLLTVYQQKNAPFAVSLVLRGLDVEGAARRFFLDGLPEVLRAQLAVSCEALHLATTTGASLATFELSRKSRSALAHQITTYCDNEKKDELRVGIEARRVSPQKLQLFLGIERPLVGRSALLEFSN